jgi:hypothetical protein
MKLRTSGSGPFVRSQQTDQGAAGRDRERGAHAPSRVVFGALAEDIRVRPCPADVESFLRGRRKQHARARALPD